MNKDFQPLLCISSILTGRGPRSLGFKDAFDRICTGNFRRGSSCKKNTKCRSCYNGLCVQLWVPSLLEMLQRSCLCMVEDPISVFWLTIFQDSTLYSVLSEGRGHKYLKRRWTISPRLWRGVGKGSNTDLPWKPEQRVPVMPWFYSRREGTRLCKSPSGFWYTGTAPHQCLLSFCLFLNYAGIWIWSAAKSCSCSQESSMFCKKLCTRLQSFTGIFIKFCILASHLCFNINIYRLFIKGYVS